jgi:hypothetical protein
MTPVAIEAGEIFWIGLEVRNTGIHCSALHQPGEPPALLCFGRKSGSTPIRVGGCLALTGALSFFLLPLSQPDPRASAVLVDEFDPGSLKRLP